MIEAQIINKVLETKSMEFIYSNNIDRTYFETFKEEFEFIEAHYMKYDTVPDKETFCNEFIEFEIFNVGENTQFLLDKIREQYAYNNVVPVIQKSAEMLQTDAIEAVSYLKTKIEPIMQQSTVIDGVNIIKNSKERWDEYIRRKELDGLLGISTGMEELDDLLHGWLPGEELVTIVGRTNEGKSWILLYFLMEAWKQGKRVLLYSGEMSELLCGYRFDTLFAHFSNRAMMKGEEELGSEVDSRTPEDYQKYLESLSSSEVPFIVITPKMLGNKRPTVQTMNLLIEKYNPDIVGIDQISLMEDYRKSNGDPARIQLAHISEDLFISSEKYKIPFLVDAQGNRKSVQKKKNDESIDKAPELDEISESDAIAQNSSRVISIKQTSAGLRMAIRKNRYGENNCDFLYFWDINTGRFKYIPQFNGETVDDISETNQAEDIF